MAGGVADGEEDGFLFALGFFEGNIRLGHPIDWIKYPCCVVSGWYYGFEHLAMSLVDVIAIKMKTHPAFIY